MTDYTVTLTPAEDAVIPAERYVLLADNVDAAVMDAMVTLSVDNAAQGVLTVFTSIREGGATAQLWVDGEVADTVEIAVTRIGDDDGCAELDCKLPAHDGPHANGTLQWA